jgi:hypothetical protein
MRTILGVFGRIPRPTPAMGVALLALLIACSGAAVAAIPSPDGSITACRDNKNGALRAIDTQRGQVCKASETQLAWKDGITGKVADSSHADKADKATNAADADTVDGKHASDFYASGSTVADSTHADQADSATTAGDANTLDGNDSAQFAAFSHTHSGTDITSGKVDANRIQDGPGSGLDADTLDGLDSTALGEANNLKVGRIELPKPTYNPPQPPPQDNSGTVFETNDFLIRGVCSQTTFAISPTESVSLAAGELFLVAKQPTSAITYTSEDSATPSEVFDLHPGQAVKFAGTPRNFPGFSPDTSNTYGSYSADAPSGFLEGHGSVSINNGPSGPGDTCRFSATGLGH